MDTTTESSKLEGDVHNSFQASQDSHYRISINKLTHKHSDDILQLSSATEIGSMKDEPKYIIFRSALMQLFTRYVLCHHSCPGAIAKPIGAFVTVKQVCSHCGYQRAQPRIKDTPAGNLLLSAAILYSGKTATSFPSPVSHEHCMHC